MEERQIDNGRASVFFRDRFQNGNTLLSLLLNGLDLAHGRVWTYLPEWADEAAEYRFREAITSLPQKPYPGMVVEIEQWGTEKIIDLVRVFLETHQNGYYVLTDHLGEPGDVSEEEPYFLYGDEVYYYASVDTDEKRLLWLMSLPIEWEPVALLSTFSTADESICQGSQITLSQLSSLAARTEAIICQVYDGEGYLVWSRS